MNTRKFRKLSLHFKTSSLEFLTTSSDLKQRSELFFSEADDKIRIGLDYAELEWAGLNQTGLTHLVISLNQTRLNRVPSKIGFLKDLAR